MNAVTIVQRNDVLSLYEEAFREAERHKWIESQKRGYDLGDEAIFEWYRHYWRDYCREKRLEHVSGRRRWQEFGEQQFGGLRQLMRLADPLVDRIVAFVDSGMENLEIINWALDHRVNMERVREVLTLVDVNGTRLDPAL